MLTFGIIAEGPSDQKVIENILLGCFQDEIEEPVVNYIQPPPPAPTDPSPPGGWTLVFKSIRRGDLQNALLFNDFLVIHIDTDMQEEKGYGVPRRVHGLELSLQDTVTRVIERLKSEMDVAFLELHSARIVFAIAVESIECWLLPLLCDKNRAGKTTGCLEAANRALRKKGGNGLSKGEIKFVNAYDQASREYASRKALMKSRNKNPSLSLFIDHLEALRSRRQEENQDQT